MEERKEKPFDKISILCLTVAIIFLIFSFFAPVLFVKYYSGIDFTESGNIGNTIGGLMSPFIASSGIILTFLAFYIQLMANKLLKQQIEKQSNQFRKNQIETQFYEMLKFHKENLNDLFIVFKTIEEEKRKETKIIGRNTFQYYINEFEILYQVEKLQYSGKDHDVWIKKAYDVFFYGIVDNETDNPENQILEEIQKTTYKVTECETYLASKGIQGKIFQYDYFTGYANALGHYYRHLYQMVKFIVNQEGITYSEKRNFLKILRAQLSIQEQIMLFYNWKSTFGYQWENEHNKFFTDYRMIHNIPKQQLLDFDLVAIFKNKDYQKDECHRNDTLFEFQHSHLSIN
jgi:hypothetical protein